jgi:hypothetical protein
MPKSPETLLTIGEVAARARHLARDPFAFTERARHWAKLGLLVAAGNVGEGTGRHALFPETEAYMAAVANAFADAGLPPTASRPVADAQGGARTALAEWQDEKAKGRRPQRKVVEIRFFPGGHWWTQIHDGKWVEPKNVKERIALAEAGIDPNARPMTTITVDLGELFASVRQVIEKGADRSSK